MPKTMRVLASVIAAAIALGTAAQAEVVPGDLLILVDFSTVLNIRGGGDFSGAAPFATGFGNPTSICRGPGGEVYVADELPPTVTVITAGGDFTGATPFATGLPGFVRISCTDTQVLAATVTGEIYDVTAGGDFSGAAPFAFDLGPGQFLSVHRDGAGTLWVGRSVAGDVLDVTAGGDFSGAMPFAFNGVTPVALADHGGIRLVAERFANRVVDYTAGGDLAQLPVFATVPDVVTLLSAGAAGLFAGSSANDAIYEISTGGDFIGAPPFATGFNVTLGSSMVFIAGCGDGILDSVTEQCDDGNQLTGDGCSAACVPEPCPLPPALECVAAARASLSVKEHEPGKERLVAKLLALEESTSAADFGDPVAGATAHTLCLYDAAATLVTSLLVDRGGATCGPRSKPCWRARARKGYAYTDPVGAADGVRRIIATAGRAGRGSLVVQAGNRTSRGQSALPRGIAAALQGSSSATVVASTTDGRCFLAALDTVKKADGRRFRAKSQ